MPATLTPPRFWKPKEIEDAAAGLRKQGGCESIPVDPVAIADRLGIVVMRVEFEDDSVVGTISRRGPAWEIGLSTLGSAERQIFTVAHELGHYILHLSPGEEGKYVDTDATLYRQSCPAGDRDDRTREVQANMFAAALLMPEADVRRLWHPGVVVRRLAKQFGVSETAMRFRIEQLGLWDDA